MTMIGLTISGLELLGAKSALLTDIQSISKEREQLLEKL